METCASGKYCGACNKTVRDYTRFTRAQLLGLNNDSGELCGQFAAHQLDPTLYPIKDVIPKKSFAFASLFIFLGFTGLKLNAQCNSEHTVEQVDSEQKDKSCDKEDSDEKEYSKYKKKRIRKRKALESAFLLESRGRRSTYLSWRFPFILRTSNFRGKFR